MRWFSSRNLRRAWWSVFVLGAGLRLFNIGGFNLWYDERGTAWMASLPFDRMLAATAADVHPPLFFVMEWSIVHLVGVEAWALRLPSAIASITAMYVARKLAEGLGLDLPAILASGVIMALAPFQLFFAAEARMYALLQLLVLIAALAALRRRLLWFGLALAGLLWTHNYGVIYSVALNGLALAQIWRRSGRALLPSLAGLGLVNAGAAAIYAPWALVVLGQMQEFAGGHWLYWLRPVSIGNFAYPFYTSLWMFALPERWQAPGALAVLAVLAFAVVKAVRLRHAGALALAALTLAPPLLAAGASLAWKPVYLFRALVGMSAPMYLLIGWSLTFGVRRLARMWSAAMLLPLLVIGAVNHYPTTTAQKGAGRALDAVLSQMQPGDIVYHVSLGTLMETWPDYTERAYLMPGIPGSAGGLTPASRQAMGMREVSLTELEWRRAWLVWAGGPTTVADEDAAVAGLLARYPHQQVRELGDGELVTGGVWLLWP